MVDFLEKFEVAKAKFSAQNIKHNSKGGVVNDCLHNNPGSGNTPFQIEEQEHPSSGQFYGPSPVLASQPDNSPRNSFSI